MSAARSLSSDSTIDTWTSGSISSSASAATSSSIVSNTDFALGRREVLDDVGDVGRVQLRQTFVGDLQLDAAGRVGFEQIDVLPRDHPRRNPLEQRPQRERRHDALRQAADGAAGADVHRDDADQEVAVDRRRFELDVVDADDLAAVDVDDLLIEQVALEQQHAVGRREGCHAAASSAARTVAPAELMASGGSMRSPLGVLTIRYAMRVGWSCGAIAISRTRPRTAPVASRTVAPSSSDRATTDMCPRVEASLLAQA